MSAKISTNEAKYLEALLAQGTRTDGRALLDYRNVDIQFESPPGHVHLKLGKTQLAVHVSADIVRPLDDRPNEGVFVITTDISAMALPEYDNFRVSGDESRVARVIEKAVRRSAALDLESLCITAGKSCWMVRADVHYLNHDGNLIDATSLAVITALLHFRVAKSPHTPELVLSVLHIPVSVSFSFFGSHEKRDDAVPNNRLLQNNRSIVVDATLAEERVRRGDLTITMNTNKDICQIYKAGGHVVEVQTLMDCVNHAYNVTVQLTRLITSRLQQHRDSLGSSRVLSALNERAPDRAPDRGLV